MIREHSPRPKQAPVVARWWKNPYGYCLHEGKLASGTRQLVCHFSGVATLERTLEEFEEGYCPWILDELENPQWLFPAHEDGDGTVIKWIETPIEFEPLREPALHRKFASVSTAAECLSFANEFGFLGVHIWELIFEDGFFSWGELVEEWLAEANKMRLLLDAWDAFRSGTDEETDRFVVIGCEDAAFRLETLEQYEPLPDDHIYGDYYCAWQPVQEHGERVRNALRMLIRESCRKTLAANTSPWFDIVPGSQLSLAPTTLLGAMYVVFLQELMGRSDPLFRCASCGKWFIQRHAGRIYCSQACKQKAYRRGLTKQKESNGK